MNDKFTTFEANVTVEEVANSAANWSYNISDSDASQGRAKKALDAVSAYVSASDLDGDDTLETALKDLVGDLHHLADRAGIDMSELTFDAVERYKDERELVE